MHDLVGKSKYAVFHGHRTVPDFTETPSQLLEYWCWMPECLQKLSCHYSYISSEYRQHWLDANRANGVNRAQGANVSTQPPIELPHYLVQNLVAAKQVNQGILTLRQIAFSKFDMRIHNPESHQDVQILQISEIYNSLLQEATQLQGPEGGFKWGNGYVTTSHYVWGQEATYYSYLSYVTRSF